MKRALIAITLLAVGLTVALVLRANQLRAAQRGPAGGTGVIEGVDVNVTSRIATRIHAIDVKEGDVVKQGDLLVELDCKDAEAALLDARSRLEAAQANLEAAQSSAQASGSSASAAVKNIGAARSQVGVLESQAEQAGRDLERAEQLFAKGALPRSMVDDARTRKNTLQAQIAAQRASEAAARDQASALSTTGRATVAQALAAKSNLGVAQAAVARAEVSVDECRLTAPRSAMVAVRALEPGEAVQPGTVILTLTDISEAKTRFYLPNQELGAAAPGRAVRVVADAYPGQVFQGTITYVAPRAEFTPRNVQTREDRERLVYAVEVRIPNADQRLRAGMPVEVEIEGSRP